MTLIYLLYMSWLETLGLKRFKNINTCCLLICQSCSAYRNIAHMCTLTWGSKFYHLHYQFSQNSRHLLNSEVVSKIQLTEVFVFRSAYIQGTWANFLELSWKIHLICSHPSTNPFFTSLPTSFWINNLFWDIFNTNHIWAEVLPENPVLFL